MADPVTAFWHPFADMSAVAGRDFVIASGDGAYVVDESGRRYLDSTAALWYANVGHGRESIAAAVAKQMTSIASYSNFGDYSTRVTLDLADRLAAMAPMPDARIFFTSGGSDAVDTAAKLARRYWQVRGQHDRTVIISRTRAYHGMHMAGTALAGIPGNKDGYGSIGMSVANVEWDDADALARTIDEIGAGNVAAFFCEPVIGAGGIFFPPAGYLEAVRRICAERDVLFVADEVITGFGRTGRMFASEGLDPDMMLVAKGLTSGYQPMGAVFVAGRIAEPFWTTPGLIWRHGYTYSGHACAAAAAMANLDIIEQESLVDRVASLQVSLSAALLGLREHSWVTDVRTGMGLLGAVTIDPQVLADDPTTFPRLIRAMREEGVVSRMLADGSFQVSPPFVITRDELQYLAGAIDRVLTDAGSVRSGSLRGLDDVELIPELVGDDSGGFGSLDASLRENVPPHHG